MTQHQVNVASHLLLEGGDDESTDWTERAKAVGTEVIKNAHPRTAQFIELHGEWIVVEIVGQAPDRNKFRQGLRHERLRFLLELEDRGIRVLLAFYHGTWEYAWLSALPDPVIIKSEVVAGRDEGRVGWYAGEDSERACFWVLETFSLDDLPPAELPRAAEWSFAQDRLGG